jgi:hypothetical protein
MPVIFSGKVFPGGTRQPCAPKRPQGFFRAIARALSCDRGLMRRWSAID